MERVSKADKNNRRKDTRAQILNVAQEIMASQGIQALSLRKISEKLQIQPPSIYTHFKGINAIVEAVSVRVYRSFANIQNKRKGANSAEDLSLHIDALIDHMAENPVYIQLMLHDFGAVRTKDEMALVVESQIDASFSNVQKILDRGAESGDFRKVSAEVYLAFIFGADRFVNFTFGHFRGSVYYYRDIW